MHRRCPTRFVSASLFLSVAALALVPLHAEPPAARLALALRPLIESHDLAGAVLLVADKDGILATESVGYADIAAKQPMKNDALFWIASMTKAMTAAAVMALVDDGKLKLDDPVEKYIPEFKTIKVLAENDADHQFLKKPGHPITIRECLSHTTGLVHKSAIETPTLDELSLRINALCYAMGPLQFEPGTSYRYSNAGINTAGRIIEIVSGMKYEDFLDQRVLKPLGMTDTTFWPSEEQVKRLAKSYKSNADKSNLEETTIGQLTYPLTKKERQPMPGGGLFSTAADVSKFCRMLLNNGTHDGKRVLSEAAVKEMTTRQTAPQIKESYGLGLQANPDNFGHGGAFATNMSVDRTTGLVTVFMVQVAGWRSDQGKQAGGIFGKTAKEVFGKKTAGAAAAQK